MATNRSMIFVKIYENNDNDKNDDYEDEEAEETPPP